MTTTGTFFGIGVGPGDPELMTRKAARILAGVDLIFMPASATGGPGFANKIIADLHLDSSRFRGVALRMSRDRDRDLEVYDRVAEDIILELRRGLSVAWITEGDPLLYSTFVHVWRALVRQDPSLTVEIVPGVTSVSAASARAGVEVATLDEKVAIVPAEFAIRHLATLVEEFETLFLMKVGHVMDALLDKLASLPVRPKSYYVEKVGTAEERIVRDLSSLRGARTAYFSLVILRRAD